MAEYETTGAPAPAEYEMLGKSRLEDEEPEAEDPEEKAWEPKAAEEEEDSERAKGGGVEAVVEENLEANARGRATGGGA